MIGFLTSILSFWIAYFSHPERLLLSYSIDLKDKITWFISVWKDKILFVSGRRRGWSFIWPEEGFTLRIQSHTFGSGLGGGLEGADLGSRPCISVSLVRSPLCDRTYLLVPAAPLLAHCTICRLAAIVGCVVPLPIFFLLTPESLGGLCARGRFIFFYKGQTRIGLQFGGSWFLFLYQRLYIFQYKEAQNNTFSEYIYFQSITIVVSKIL